MKSRMYRFRVRRGAKLNQEARVFARRPRPSGMRDIREKMTIAWSWRRNSCKSVQICEKCASAVETRDGCFLILTLI